MKLDCDRAVDLPCPKCLTSPFWSVNILSSKTAWRFGLLSSGGDHSVGCETSGMIPECGFFSADVSVSGARSVVAGGFSLLAGDLSDARRNDISVKVCVYAKNERPQPRMQMMLYEDWLSH